MTLQFPKNFTATASWASAGAAAAALGPALALAALARWGGVEPTGRYAFALAVTTPLFVFARLGLRWAATTDGTLPLAPLLRARLLCSGAAWAATAALCVVAGWSAGIQRAVLWLATARVGEEVGESTYGVLQRGGGWRRIAASQCLRAACWPATLGGAAAFGFGLTPALAAAALWQAAATLALDVPAARAEAPSATPRTESTSALLGRTFPLGVAAGLVSLIGYAPRYAIFTLLGEGSLGLYAAAAQVALLGNLPVQAMCQAALHPLSLLREDGRAFARMLRRLRLAAASVGVIGAAAAAAFGEPLLVAIYGRQLDGQGALLLWLAAGAGFTYQVAVQGFALNALGLYRAQPAIYAAAAVAACALSFAAVPAYGLAGAAGANLVAWAIAAFIGRKLLWSRWKPDARRYVQTMCDRSAAAGNLAPPKPS